MLSTKASSISWLAFDLNVLRRLRFGSVALPFCDTPEVASYLKRTGVRVSANHILQSAWTQLMARVSNSYERLTNEDVDLILDDAYVPQYQYHNPGLTAWFNETDSWWFDNVWQKIDQLTSPAKCAIASSVAMQVGDYALSFNELTRQLRQPLSKAFRRFADVLQDPYDNGVENPATHNRPDEFLAETRADLMFMRLPAPHAGGLRPSLGRDGWREEWIHGENSFWTGLDRRLSGRLGGATETKSQYLHCLGETLERASHMRTWAIALVEAAPLSTQDIVETVASIRRVDTIYTKDFSELTGHKAVIIVA